jgi:hypothetical protein
MPGEKSQGMKGSKLIWEKDNFRIGSDNTDQIQVPMPASVRQHGDALAGWLVASYADRSDNELTCDVNSGECDAIYSQTNKEEQKKESMKQQFIKQQQAVLPIDFTRVQRDIRRYESYLVGPDRSVLSEDHSSPDALYTHFKYLRYPLTVRIVHFGHRKLASNTIPEIGYVFFTHKDNSRKVRDLFYEPILYLDDVNLLKSQCLRINTNLSAPDPKITFKIVATTPAYFSVKMLEEIVFGQIEHLGVLGETELEDMRRMVSDDYLYRYLLTIAISWVHIYLEYVAFRHDLSFFVVRLQRIAPRELVLTPECFRVVNPS